MNIPPKYEDIVAELEASNKLCDSIERSMKNHRHELGLSNSREAALREELASANSDKEAFGQNAIDLRKKIQELNGVISDRIAGRNALQQRLTVAEQRAIIMEKSLTRIARPHDCGCLPCTGDCKSKLSLEITVDGMRETAELALKELCETCHDQGEIFVSKGKFEYGMESEPDPIYKPCPVCSKAALKPAAEVEALDTRPAGCCCPPKGHTGIWAASMCPVHFGLKRHGVKP